MGVFLDLSPGTGEWDPIAGVVGSERSRTMKAYVFIV